MRRFFSFTISILFLALSSPAGAQELITDLAKDRVEITTDFSGGQVTLFGVTERPGDIVVKLTGPRKEAVVRSKGQVLGAWINNQSFSFNHVPSFYKYAASKPLMEISSGKALADYELGLDNLVLTTDPQSIKKESYTEFRNALIRNKRSENLYIEAPGQFDFLTKKFFRVSFYLPPNVQVGAYTIETYLFEKGALKSKDVKAIQIEQIGLSAKIHSYAKNNALLYGLFCVFFAMFAGWFSNRVRS